MNINEINTHLFEKVHKFQGIIEHKQKEVLKDWSFEVRHSTRKPSIIRGHIKGEIGRIDELMNLSRMMYQGGLAKIRSKNTEEDTKYEANGIFIWQASSPPPRYESRMVEDIASFDVKEFTSYHRIANRDGGANRDERLISFALSGPRDFFSPVLWTERHFRKKIETGDACFDPDLPEMMEKKGIEAIETRHFYRPLNIDICNLLNIRVSPEYVSDDGHGFEISDYYPSIIVKTNESPKERSDDEFQSLAIEIVNDILLVSSMVAGCWIDWFSWEFYSSDKHVYHVRSLERDYADEIRHDCGERGKFLEGFLAKAVQALRDRKKEKFDLSIPLGNWITARTEPPEQKFILYFLALEKLKDMYAKNNEKETEKYKYKNGGYYLWSVLEILLNRYDVEWKNLYPSDKAGSSPAFLALRNALIHSAETICDEVLYYETERTRILLTRLIVKLLGCQESDWAKTFLDAEYLSRRPMYSRKK
ncbi:MAG: hypothetical protein F4X17_15290 [Gemmatimonadetes bacterium]|nr:hypothetical protein [Gemmatimonadota bacterium]